MAAGAPRDALLIDALEAIPPAPLEGTLWRVTREGRDPCIGSSSGGRWDDTSFDVLYTSETREGAVAEMHFHLRQGQPLVPSKLRYALHELRIVTAGLLVLTDHALLAKLGVDMSRYGRLVYVNREQEYLRSQAIGEVAHFLDFTALKVPNARHDSSNNVVLFTDRIDPDQLEHVHDHGVIDFNARMS